MPQTDAALNIIGADGNVEIAPAQAITAAAASLAETRPNQPAYTFVDYSADLDGTPVSLTWRDLDTRARAVAAELLGGAKPGERVAILAPQGLGYVTAMLGAFYANVIAVPLFLPDLPGHRDRLDRIVADAEPSYVLTTESALSSVTEFLRGHRPASLRAVLAVDAAGLRPSPGWRAAPNRADDVAYLQYTSGSTRLPAGVMITHGCLSANAAQIAAALSVGPGTVTSVSWLPLFHDMGLLMTVAMPIATAFAIATEQGERVVVVAERSRQGSDLADLAAVARAVRGAVAVRHNVRLHDFMLVEPGAVPRTSSGKISRTASRDRYLAGAFRP